MSVCLCVACVCYSVDITGKLNSLTVIYTNSYSQVMCDGTSKPLRLQIGGMSSCHVRGR